MSNSVILGMINTNRYQDINHVPVFNYVTIPVGKIQEIQNKELNQ